MGAVAETSLASGIVSVYACFQAQDLIELTAA